MVDTTKPIAAVDIDDVIVETAPSIIENYNQRYGTSLTLTSFYSDDPDIWQTSDIDEAITRVHDYLKSPEYWQVKPTQEAIHALRGLSRVYRLVVVTGRARVIEQATEAWIHEELPGIFDDVIHSYYFDVGEPVSKGDICRRLGAKVLIDDHLGHLEEAARYGVAGLLFGDYPWNQASELPKGVKRVHNWQEVERELLRGR